MRSGRPKEDPPKLEDTREHRRYAVAETIIRVTWLDTNGDVKTENDARPMNVSERGMAVELSEAALLLSRVRLEADNGELLGHGKVRHCRATGTNYAVGIEFTDSLYWSPPEGPINEPIPLSPPRDEEELRPGGESAVSRGVAQALPEELLWSETLQPPTGLEGTRGMERAEGTSSESTDVSMRPLPELHLSLDSGQGFFARLPMAMKAGGAIIMALALGSFLWGHGRMTSGSNAGDAAMSIVGEQGWITEWASDPGGSRRGRQITIYRPSKPVSDYQVQFTGQIERKALGWVFRAADTKNYYGMKIENDKPGSVRYTRFAVVNGRESSLTQTPLPIHARVDTAYSVKLEVSGPRFAVYIQGEPVELWTDDRLKTGAFGFMNETQESGRTSSVRFSFQNVNGQ